MPVLFQRLPYLFRQLQHQKPQSPETPSEHERQRNAVPRPELELYSKITFKENVLQIEHFEYIPSGHHRTVCGPCQANLVFRLLRQIKNWNDKIGKSNSAVVLVVERHVHKISKKVYVREPSDPRLHVLGFYEKPRKKNRRSIAKHLNIIIKKISKIRKLGKLIKIPKK